MAYPRFFMSPIVLVVPTSSRPEARLTVFEAPLGDRLGFLQRPRRADPNFRTDIQIKPDLESTANPPASLPKMPKAVEAILLPVTGRSCVVGGLLKRRSLRTVLGFAPGCRAFKWP